MYTKCRELHQYTITLSTKYSSDEVKTILYIVGNIHWGFNLAKFVISKIQKILLCQNLSTIYM